MPRVLAGAQAVYTWKRVATGRTGPNLTGMTTTTELPRESWGAYFDTLSKYLGTTEATVEIVGKDLGDQLAAERLVLTGITYDHKDDVVVIGLDAPGGNPEEYQHLVYKPQKILVAPGGAGAEMVVDIEDAEGNKHIVRLERPPALPPG
jgi:hypothetical protein